MHVVVSLSVSLSLVLLWVGRGHLPGTAELRRSAAWNQREEPLKQKELESGALQSTLLTYPLKYTHTHTHARLVLDRIWCAVGRSYPVQEEPSQKCTLGSRPLHLKLIKTIMRFIACSCSVLSFPVISIQTKMFKDNSPV